MGVDRPDLSPIAGLYDESLRSHGETPMGVGWRTEDSQRLRFDKLLTVLEGADGGPIEVNDLGCGYGALFEHLEQRATPVTSYVGYDISDDMLRAAAQRVPPGRGRLVRSDTVTLDADYSFASGIFNVRLEADEEAWSAYVRATVRNLAAHSRRGFAFNLLTTYCDYREDHLFYGDPRWWFDWCKREVTSRVALLHDYPLFEWTLVGRT
ncbi:MAG: class I SAM-dependent methyltransferase [Acidimicrobiales bacterium]